MAPRTFRNTSSLITLLLVCVHIPSQACGYQTDVRCKRLPHMVDYCMYENLCYGSNLPLFRDARPVPEMHSNFGWSMHLCPLQQVPKSRLLPFKSFTSLAHIQDGTYEFIGGTAFMAFFDASVPNPFHFAQKVMVAAVVNYTEGITFTHVLLQRSSLGEWEKGLTTALFPNSTVLMQSELAQYTTVRPVCFEKVVIPGTAVFMYLDPEQAYHARKRILQEVGVSKLTKSQITVTFVNRPPAAGRHIVNHAELIQRIRGPDVEVTYIEDLSKLSFRDQVILFSQSNIIIAPHGAGLTNCMFLNAGSAVLEIYQPKMNYHLYEMITILSGSRHIGVTTLPSEVIPGGKDCDIVALNTHYVNTTSEHCMNDNRCLFSVKGCNHRTDVSKLVMTYHMALEMLQTHEHRCA